VAVECPGMAGGGRPTDGAGRGEPAVVGEPGAGEAGKSLARKRVASVGASINAEGEEGTWAP